MTTEEREVMMGMKYMRILFTVGNYSIDVIDIINLPLSFSIKFN